MKAEQMWEVSKGEGVTIAVIDTGVDASHPDLQGRILEGKDFSPEPGTAHDDYDGHGTGMAAVIAGTGQGRDGQGGLGLAPGSKILPLRVGEDGDLTGAETDEFLHQISEAIRFAVDNDVKVINISQAARQGSEELTQAVEYALSKDVLIFAGTGNEGERDEPVVHPAAAPGVVAVAAVDKTGKATAESQSGPEVDLAAPGLDIVHGCGDSSTGYCKSHGTSDATALASASAALIWAEHPDWTANQVLRVMINTAGAPTDGVERNNYIGYGVVRPRIALKTPGDPGPADVSPLPEIREMQQAEASPSGKPGNSAAEGEGEPRPKGSDQAAAAPGDGDDGGSIVPWIGAGAAVVVVAGAAAFLVLRNRRRTTARSGGFGAPPPPWQ
ncbi:type VII secretion-associated serine protease mycosin [Streptomyces capparidis]